MFYHFKLLGKLISVQIRSQMQYRASFLFDVLGAFFIVITEFGAVALVLPKFNNIGGWVLGEVALLYGTVNLAFGIMDMVFSGFDDRQFGMMIRRGGFDQMLLRPVNITVQVLGSDFQLRRIGRIFMGGVLIVLSASMTDIQWTPTKAFLLALAVISQVAYFGGLFIIGATVTFWTIDSIEGMNILTYGGTELISYPMTIYPKWMQRFFTWFMPAIFLNYFPALYILGKPDPYNFPAFAPWLAPVAGILVLGIGLKYWQYGISKYQSTGT